MPSASNLAACTALVNRCNSCRKSTAANRPRAHFGAAATSRNTLAYRWPIPNRFRFYPWLSLAPPPAAPTGSTFPASTSSPAPIRRLRTPRSPSCVRVVQTGRPLVGLRARIHGLFFQIAVRSILAGFPPIAPRVARDPSADFSVPSAPDNLRTTATPRPRSLPTATRFSALCASQPLLVSINAELRGQADVD